MKIFRLFFLCLFVLCGCRGAEQGAKFSYQWENEPGPIDFYPISELKFPEKPDILLSHFGSGFFEEGKEPLQVSGSLSVTEDFSHLDTKMGLSFRSHKPYKPPFTLVDMSFGHQTHIIEHIVQVQEIPSLTGQSAFLLTFQKKEDNPLSGILLSGDFDLEKMLYYQGSGYGVLDSFWLREKALPKLWSGDLWHLEVDVQQEIPEYFVIKNQEKVGSFFSLPGAQSLVHSFQVDDQGRWVAYQKTTKKSAGAEDFVWQFAFERNGEDLLAKYDFSEVMALTTLKNQIFFFFKTKEEQIGYWWNGHRYLTDFEEIEDAGCCAAPQVLISAEGKLRFLAKKDGVWQEFEGSFDGDFERRKSFRQSGFLLDQGLGEEFDNVLPVNFERSWDDYRFSFYEPMILLARGWNAYIKSGFAQFGSLVRFSLPLGFSELESFSSDFKVLPDRVAIFPQDRNDTREIQFYQQTREYSPCLQADTFRATRESDPPKNYTTGTVATTMGALPYLVNIFSVYDEEGSSGESEQMSICIFDGAKEYVLDLYDLSVEEKSQIFDSLYRVK